MKKNIITKRIHIGPINGLLTNIRGSFNFLSFKNGYDYAIQFSLKDPWWKPHKDTHFCNNYYTLYGWFFFYFGKSNHNWMQLRRDIAEQYNNDPHQGLKTLAFYSKFENECRYMANQSWNVTKHPFFKDYKQAYHEELKKLLEQHDFHINEDNRIVSIFDVPLKERKTL